MLPILIRDDHRHQWSWMCPCENAKENSQRNDDLVHRTREWNMWTDSILRQSREVGTDLNHVKDGKATHWTNVELTRTDRVQIKLAIAKLVWQADSKLRRFHKQGWKPVNTIFSDNLIMIGFTQQHTVFCHMADANYSTGDKSYYL